MENKRQAVGRPEELALTPENGSLVAWLGAHVPELGDGPLEMERLKGGSSNDVVRIDRGRTSAVLRSPRLTDEKILAREAHVLASLAATSVPHSRLLAYCTDRGVIGRNFIVSDMIHGTDGNRFMVE